MPRSISFAEASPGDAEAIAALQTAVARDLTARYGRGHWSHESTVKGVLFGMTRAKVYVGERRGRLLATFALSKRKPWAIDTSYFGPCKMAVYLTGMAVSLTAQNTGIGSLCIEEAIRRAKAWPADAIRLDAYDTAGGAGGFYLKCGFREVGKVIYRKTPLVYLEMRFDPL